MVTLVLGAGVSCSRGVPAWPALARTLWERVFSPRERRFAFPEGGKHPFELQIAFEILAHELEHATDRRKRTLEEALAERERARAAPLFAQRSSHPDDLFLRHLYEALYEHVRAPAAGERDTLGAIASHVRAQIEREGRCSIARILTFNADDLLETEINREPGAPPLVWPLARETHHPRRDLERCISVYHLHGYLPRPGRTREESKSGQWRGAPDGLVFTDLQYWRSLASPMSFGNRVMAHALHDSHCVFVGVSMSDVNVMRWLGLRAVEFERDKQSQHGERASAARRASESLAKHYWIRRASDDPSRTLGALLERRGVRSIVIDGWTSGELDGLLREALVG